MQLCNFKTLKKAPFLFKRATLALQKSLICIAIVVVLQCKKGFFAHLKLYFESAKKPFWNMNGVCDSVKTIKTDSQIL